MIKPITRADLPACLTVFHEGYETVAIEFGLTEENCPDRGRASLPFAKLEAMYDAGTLMFGYYVDDMLVGYLGMTSRDDVCGIDDLSVLPEHRHKGYGKTLLDFGKAKAVSLGASKIRLGMIDDNKRLRKWYEENGFVTVAYKQYDGAPFLVGKMEYICPPCHPERSEGSHKNSSLRSE